MGTISQLHGRVRPPAHRIQSDEEALDIARALATGFARQSSDRDVNRILPFDELDTLAQSGLLGITVPSEYDGLDISNAILAEIVAILSEADPSIGQIPQNHFYTLEALRTDGSEEQKRFFFARALTGDRFANAISEASLKGAGPQHARLAGDGLGYRIDGQKFYSTGALFAEWLAILAHDPAGKLTMSFVPRGTEGVQIIDDWDGFGQRTTGSGTIILHNVYINADAVVAHHKGFERPTVIGPVAEITHAGIDLGIARAAFADMVQFVKQAAAADSYGRSGDQPLIVARIGEIAIRLEAATATVERAGKKVDAAQVSPTEQRVIEATLAAAAARVLATEIALEASNALFELAGTSATRIGLNLDRHWRNARTHTLHDPARQKHHAVGNYHLNGITPPQSDLP
jgi:SfnB family sulfur acquisition oxidoreductase